MYHCAPFSNSLMQLFIISSVFFCFVCSWETVFSLCFVLLCKSHNFLPKFNSHLTQDILYPQCINTALCLFFIIEHTYYEQSENDFRLVETNLCLFSSVKLQLQATSVGEVVIKGVCANRYLAMNRDGRLFGAVRELHDPLSVCKTSIITALKLLLMSIKMII